MHENIGLISLHTLNSKLQSPVEYSGLLHCKKKKESESNMESG